MKSKTIKTISIIFVLLVIGIIIYFTLPLLNTRTIPTGKLSGNFDTYDDLVTKTPIIVIGEATKDVKKITYEEVDFVISTFTTEEIIRNEKYGDMVIDSKDLSTIKILQTVMVEDPIIENGDTKLLFLRPYTGPVAKDVYVICGLYEGQFDLKKDKLVPVSIGNSPKERNDIPSTLEDALKSFENANYIPDLTPKEIEEIVKENEGKSDVEIDEILQEKRDALVKK